MAGGLLRLAALALTGLTVAAIIHASRKLDKHIDDAFADAGDPFLPDEMRVDGPTETGGGGWQPNRSDRPFETHNVMFRTHDKGAFR